MSGPRRVGPAYLALFIALYAIQGVVIAYFFNFNQISMIDAGVPKDVAAGVQSLALVPFILKFLGGPLSDRVSLLGLGHRKPYIVLGLALQTLGLVGLSSVDPGRALHAFAALAILTVSGLALYDTCCDGMVIDVTPVEDRARVQGTLVAARALAAMACSFAFGAWLEAGAADPRRYHRVLWACAGLGMIPLAQALLVREPARASDAETFDWSALRVLIRPHSLVLLAFGALYAIVGYGVEINLSPYYRALHLDEGNIGKLASVRYIGRAAGASLLTLAARRLSRGQVLAIGLLALSGATAGQAFVADPISAAAAGFLFGAANGWDDAIFFVLAMEASDPRMAASTYALFMAVTNVSVAGGWLFARTESAFGDRYPPAFLASAVVTLVALVLVPPLSRRRPAPEPEPQDALA